jgi:hypothetical protein
MTPSPGQRWSESFTEPSGEAFAQITAPGITLDGSIFARPIQGRHAVWATLSAASGSYDSLVFTHHVAADGRVYLEWNATALGLRIDGVTILVADDEGLFAQVALHHRRSRQCSPSPRKWQDAWQKARSRTGLPVALAVAGRVADRGRDRPGVRLHGRARHQDGRRRLNPESGGAGGHVRRPVQIGRF